MVLKSQKKAAPQTEKQTPHESNKNRGKNAQKSVKTTNSKDLDDSDFYAYEALIAEQGY